MIIFLFGEDEFRSHEKLKEIENKFLEKNSSGKTSGSFDFEEDKNISISEIKKSFGLMGLFSGKQLIVIKNVFSSAPKNTISEFLEFLKLSNKVPGDRDLVVVFWEKGKTNEKNELFKYLIKNAKSQKFDLLFGAKLNQWIAGRFVRENSAVKVSQTALDKLVAYTGGDLQILENEIKKLANFKNKGNIGEEDIEILVKKKISSNIFDTVEALSGGNKKQALKLFHEQLIKGDDPLYILMMYVYQFRNFLKVSEYYEQRKSNSYEIAKNTGLHPFVVKKILGQISKFSGDKLNNIYKKLQQIDEKVKTGKGDAKVELDRFIVEI